MGTTTRPAAPYRWARERSRAAALDARLLRFVASRIGPADVRWALGDVSAGAGAEPPIATIRFRDRATLLSLVWNPVGRFGDAYSEGRIEVEGDLIAALDSVYRALESKGRPSWLRRIGTYLPHTLISDREAVQHHYDLGNEFYRLWLDDRMLYSCAYFQSPAQTLEAAQLAKMDHVCRKLGLRAGETVIEAGCGWGSLALHMAKNYGVRVRAFNLSTEQIAWARAQAEREQLTSRVEFVQRDYRDIDGTCDAFVSVGMLEHVGRGSYGELAAVLTRTLDRTHGRGLLHFIGRDRPAPLDPWIRKRIFPRAYPPTLDEVFRGVLDPSEMSVIDVENLRAHYALTLTHWRTRYESAVAKGSMKFDEPFLRMWRLYLAGSESAFRTGWLQLFQVVFAPSGSNAVPWTREGLYRDGEGLTWNAPTS